MRSRVRRRPTSALLSTLLAALSSVTLLTTTATPARADASTVSTDTYRTGWDQNEPGLTPAQVSSSDFGQLYSTPVDGQVYAAPVVVGSTVVVATETNHVYGLDAATGAVRWSAVYGAPWPASGVTGPNPANTWSCADLAPDMGITSTPVHDPVSGYVYLTSKEDGGQYHEAPTWRMHAVDPATGREKPGFPVIISGTPDNDPSRPFDPLYENQRPGLLLLNGVVYAGFGGICDQGTWRGYVVGVDTTGRQTAMWTSQVGTRGAGIWSSGAGLIADAQGHILFSTGNGVSPPAGPGSSPPKNLAESVVALTVQADGTLKATDFFSPADADELDLNDVDLGAGGVMAIPDEFGTGRVPHLAVTAGKDGRVFLLDRPPRRPGAGGQRRRRGGADPRPLPGVLLPPGLLGRGRRLRLLPAERRPAERLQARHRR
ncbi:PQQ-binding-like beta-propeller repeat protein [Kitasatospora aureofaciens]|uniref:outer membrane protein assembly factor BamB family protein n=1 Tax=Kitasatospora aureofaciens TaxID=1894 RepID=UPI0033E3DFC8